MQELDSSANPNQAFVRRSSRKRRSPGEWWKEYRVEERIPLARTSSNEAEARKALRLSESILSPFQESKDSNARDLSLCDPSITGENREVDHVVLRSIEGFWPDTSALGVTEKTTEVISTVSIPSAGRNAASESHVNANCSNSNKNAEQLDNDFESHGDGESGPLLNVDNRVCISSAICQQRTGSSLSTVIMRRPGIGDTTISGSSSQTGNAISGESLRTNDCESSRPLSGKANRETTLKPQELISWQHRGNLSDTHVDRNRDSSDRNDRQIEEQPRTKRSEQVTEDAPEIDRKVWGTSESLGRHESRRRFSGARPHDSTEASNLWCHVKTPPVSRKLSITGFVDDPKHQTLELSKANAPRKSRPKLVSPRYSFSQRSHLNPQLSPSLMPKAAENKLAPIDEITEQSRYARHAVLVAKKTALRYHLVSGLSGTVKVAISISLNKNTVGEMVILPRSTTGPRRALTGDEFYIVKQGYVECDIGFTSVALSAGDHLGIPKGQCFEIKNSSSLRCELFFFSPKNFDN